MTIMFIVILSFDRDDNPQLDTGEFFYTTAGLGVMETALE